MSDQVVMNVLFISPLFPPATGGAATYAGRLVDGMAANQQVAAFHVLTEFIPGQKRYDAWDNIHIHRLLPTRISVESPSRLMHTIRYLQTQLWFAINFLSFQRKHRISLIHFHTRYSGFLFFRALKGSGKPLLADVRDLMRNPGDLYNLADKIICNSQSVKRLADASRFPNQNIELIPVIFSAIEKPSGNAILETRQRYGVEGEYILYVGDITQNKGVYDLIDGHRDMLASGISAELIIAGPNREGEAFIDQLRDANHVTYIGRIPHSDAINLLSGATVAILPSRSEAFGQVVLEALSVGTIIICPPNIPEFAQFMPEFTLAEVSPEEIADKLTYALATDKQQEYPLERHEAQTVLKALGKIYLEMVQNEGGGTIAQ